MAAVAVAVLIAGPGHADTPADFDADAALRYSQAAIGRAVGDHRFLDRERREVHFYHRGRPPHA